MMHAAARYRQHGGATRSQSCNTAGSACQALQQRLRPLARASMLHQGSAAHISLIATDVDGTLLNSAQHLTPRVEAAVRAADAAGVPLIVATGKARGPWVPEVLPRLGVRLPGVFLQGLLIVDADGTVLHSRCLPDDVVADCIRLAESRGVTLTAYCFDRIFCKAVDEHTNRLLFYKEPTPEPVGDLSSRLLGRVETHKLIFMAPQPVIDSLRPGIEASLAGRASVTTALSGMLEVLPHGASKGAGLEWLLDHLGVCPALQASSSGSGSGSSSSSSGADASSNGSSGGARRLRRGLLALGDGENDSEMLQAAEVAVAMANAGLRLRRLAHLVTASNDEDGVAQAIERLVLEPRGLELRAGV